MAVLGVYVVKLRLSKYLSVDMFRCVFVFKTLKFNIFHAFLVDIFHFVVVFFSNFPFVYIKYFFFTHAKAVIIFL